MSDYHNPYIPELEDVELENMVLNHSKVLIQVEEKEGVTDGGLLLNTALYYSPSDRGVVLKTGRDVKSVREGDRVVFRWQTGDDFAVDGEHWLFLDEHELIGKVED